MHTSNRMLRTLAVILTPLVLIASLLIGYSPLRVGASSHREAPLISKDPSVDNTDVYAFVSPDEPSTITLISNWIPFEDATGGPNYYHFDDNARYYIKIDQDGDAVEDISYLWTFRTEINNPGTFLYNTNQVTSLNDPDFNYTQYYTVTEILGTGEDATETVLFDNELMPPDNVGPRSLPNYQAVAQQAINEDSEASIKEFTGQRDDPFFVDIGAIFDLGGLRPFNNAHIIPLPVSKGLDDVGGFNIHTTALQVPITRLAPECPVNAQGIPTNATDKRCVIGVWSTAERPAITVRTPGTESPGGGSEYVQVSRLGHPLVNEVVMNLALKDTFNAVPPSVDRTVPAVVERVNDPELAQLIPVLYAGTIDTVPSAPRTDLFTIFLTGIPGITEQENSMETPSEQLRLNTAIAPTAGVCAGEPLGAIAGDLAGYPNGRRLEDDVTDIAIRAVAGGYGEFLEDQLGLPNLSPNNLLGDGVDENDKPCLDSFPYMASPHSGYRDFHPFLSQLVFPLIGNNTAGLGALQQAR